MTNEKFLNEAGRLLSDDELEKVTGGSDSYSAGGGTMTVSCACYEKKGYNCKKGGTYNASAECVQVYRCVYAVRV